MVAQASGTAHVMRVDLVTYTPDPLDVLYRAYRACYSAEAANDIDASALERDELEIYLSRRLATGHTQPLEQVAFVFAISGVSRAFSHQFVRHRVGVSYAQQSQRYVEGAPPVVVPPSIKGSGRARAFFWRSVASASNAYEELVKAGVPAEDARFVLPSAAETSMQVSVNMAALLHIADRRLCTRAQWEVRRVGSGDAGEGSARRTVSGPDATAVLRRAAGGFLRRGGVGVARLRNRQGTTA